MQSSFKVKAMASPACASVGLLVLLCFSLCPAHRLLLESAGVHTYEGSSGAANRAKNAKAKLLHHHNPFQRELLDPFSISPVSPPPPDIPFKGDLVNPHNPSQGEELPLHSPAHHYVVLSPKVELLLQEQSNVKNFEPKPPGLLRGSDWAETDLELGLPGPRPNSEPKPPGPPGSDWADTDPELGLPGPRPPGSDWSDTDPELGLPGPRPPGSDWADGDSELGLPGPRPRPPGSD